MDESKLLQQAQAYADHDDYVITQNIIVGLLAIIKSRGERIAELERVNGDLVQCANCLEKRAEAAFGALQDVQGAAVGYWENDK